MLISRLRSTLTKAITIVGQRASDCLVLSLFLGVFLRFFLPGGGGGVVASFVHALKPQTLKGLETPSP